LNHIECNHTLTLTTLFLNRFFCKMFCPFFSH